MTPETGDPRARSLAQARSLLAPLAVYLGVAALTTWPLVLHPRALLGAPSGPGDPFLNLWILGWGMQSVLGDPGSLLTGGVFNANIFHPAAGTLAYSDHLLLQSVILSPLYALTGDVVLCYNVLLVTSLVASALAMHVFIRDAIGTESGAYLAGLAWGFGSFRFAHLIHLQLQSLYFLPLAFLCLHRLAAGRRRREAVALGVVAGLQALSSVYWGVIGGLALVVAGVTLAVSTGRWRAILGRLAAAGVVSVILVAPVALVYWRVAQAEGFGRNLFEASRNAAYASSYLQVPSGNLVYGRTDILRLRDDASPLSGPPRTGPERELFPGFILMSLAVCGVWLGRRGDARATVASMVALAGLGFVLSLGPDGVRPLYAALHRFVFGFQAIRAPARFSVLVMFGLCTLAAIGWRELTRSAHTARGIAISRAGLAVLMACAIAEWAHVPLVLAAAPPLHTDVGVWLSQAPETGAVAVLPLDVDIASTPAMVQSLEHRRRIVNGYSGQRPSFYGPLVEALNTFPSSEALLALRESGVRFVVTPAPVAPPDEAGSSPVVERARFAGGTTIYEMRWTAESEASLTETAAVVPPPPGPIPFPIGEVATYTVQWGGGGVNLSAGSVSIAVEEPAYRLVVVAETAPWVAQFFEARDRFTTQADSMLLPEQHERVQQEGSRHVERAFVYDRAAGVVRSGRSVADAKGVGAVVLPMAPAARDAISALFYARTLPLRQGDRYRIPVNEAGRNVVVDVSVDGREQIRVQGADVDAVRLTPRLARRVEAREQPRATLWLSTDARRVPLAIEIDAGFGHLRIELENYRPSP